MEAIKNFYNYLTENYHSKGVYPVLRPFGSGDYHFELEVGIELDDGEQQNLTLRRGAEVETTPIEEQINLFKVVDFMMSKVDLTKQTSQFFNGFINGWMQYERRLKDEVRENTKESDFQLGYELYLGVKDLLKSN